MPVVRAQRTAVTPEVVLSTDDNTFSVEGECYPENPLPFFNSILDKLKDHFETNKPASFSAYFHLQYVNSASTKGLQSIMSVLNDAGEKGCSVLVRWAHDPEDDALEELGTDLVEDFTYIVLNREHVVL
jgi:hypothetical protein